MQPLRLDRQATPGIRPKVAQAQMSPNKWFDVLQALSKAV